MAKKKQFVAFDYFAFIPPETTVEVIALKGRKVVKKEMSYREALAIFQNPKKNGWKYQIHQHGASQFQESD